MTSERFVGVMIVDCQTGKNRLVEAEAIRARLAEIRKRFSKTTPGEWDVGHRDITRGDSRYGSEPYNVIETDKGIVCDSMNADTRVVYQDQHSDEDGMVTFTDEGTWPDFAFMATAHQDVPFLLDVIEALLPSADPISAAVDDQLAEVGDQVKAFGHTLAKGLPAEKESA